MNSLKSTIANLTLLKMLFNFIRIHMIDRDSFPLHKRFRTFDYDYRDRPDSDNYYDWDDDSLENIYQD